MTIHQRVGLLPVKIGGQTQPYSDDRLGRRKNSVGSALGFSQFLDELQLDVGHGPLNPAQIEDLTGQDLDFLFARQQLVLRCNREPAVK